MGCANFQVIPILQTQITVLFCNFLNELLFIFLKWAGSLELDSQLVGAAGRLITLLEAIAFENVDDSSHWSETDDEQEMIVWFCKQVILK